MNEQTMKFLDGVEKLTNEGRTTLIDELQKMAQNPEYAAKEGEKTLLDELNLGGIEKYYAHIDPAAIVYMELAADDDGKPCGRVVTREKIHDFPLVKGYQVFIFNEFLNSLNLGMTAVFETFTQYGKLISEFSELLFEQYGDEALKDDIAAS